MKLVLCPHCGHRHIVGSSIPKDVVVVMPCPSCNDLVVLFRNKTIGLKRQIIEEGTFEERKDHIAEVISHFLGPDILLPEGFASAEAVNELDQPDDDSDEDEAAEWSAQEAEEGEESPNSNPITQREFERFVKIDLQQIDDYSYFKRHFG